MSVKSQIAAVEAQIERDEKLSRQAVTLFKQFQAEEKKIQDLETFLRAPTRVSDLMLEIGRTLPNRVALRSVAYRDNGVVVRGMVRGAGDRASGEVSAYVELLRRDRIFSALFGSISQTSLARDPQSGRMTFELSFKFKETPPPAK
jgi:Tfp pilus assembly protein PilN